MKHTKKESSEVRIPPHSIEAEEQLLSACLLDGNDVITQCLEHKIGGDSFYVPANRLIYEKLITLYNDGKPLETSVLAEQLKADKHLEEVGGFAYLLRISGRVPTTAGAKFFIEKVKELSLLRNLIQRGTRIVDKAYNYNGNLADFASEVEDALRVYGSLEKGKTLSAACDDTLELIERIKAGEKSRGLPWPFKGMDERMDVAENGELIVVAARPGRGKSSFARQVAWDWSLKHGDVAYFSREMPVGQLPQLFAQSLSGMSWREARRGFMHPADLSRFCEGIREVKKNTRLHVYDKDSTITQVVSRIRALRSKLDLKAVFIDYLQAYDMKQEKGETRDLAIGRFTRCLKDIALDMNIPVVLLAQLSRAVEKEEREPRASDLRESGNIEQDADRILFTHWLPVGPDGIAQDFNDFSCQSIHAQLIQVKNRNGSSGKLRHPLPSSNHHLSMNTVELTGYYGSDETHALSAWTSTSRELDDAKKQRIPALLKQLAQAGHHTPFEKSVLHFLVRCDTATHIHILKHRIGVSVNGESARYKELKEPEALVPSDWPEHVQIILNDHFKQSVALYRETLALLEQSGLGRKRAKESARLFLPYANQLTLDVSFNFRSFHHFLALRNKPDAQLEIREVAAAMLEQVKALEGSPFKHTLEAFGY